MESLNNADDANQKATPNGEQAKPAATTEAAPKAGKTKVSAADVIGQADVLKGADKPKETPAVNTGAEDVPPLIDPSGAKPAATTEAAPANQSDANIGGVLNNGAPKDLTEEDKQYLQKKQSASIFSEESLQYLRDTLIFSTPEQRKALRDVLDEFEPKPFNLPVSNSPANIIVKTDEELKEEQEKAKVIKFGEDYVDAKKGQETTTFTAIAWDMMTGDKEGWKRSVKTPKEVKELVK